jgi:hypothetical protein
MVSSHTFGRGSAWVVSGAVIAIAASGVAPPQARGSGAPLVSVVPRFRVPATASTAGVLPMAIAVGDVNGDGRSDVVEANKGPAAFNGSVGVGLGDGAGGIAPAVTTALPNGWGACSVAVGDLTRDGKADVVVLGCVSSGPGPIFVLKATGGAALTLVQTLPNTANGTIGIADLANDGQPDLVFSATGSADVRVYKGVGGGTFSAPTAAPASSDSYHIAIGDVTGDGRPDVVGAAGGPVWVMPGTASGGLGPQVVTFSSQLQAYNLALGQFDADGKLDVATVDASGGNLFIGLGTGDGHFVPRTSFAGVSSQSLWAATGDFTGDGKIDVVTNGDRQDRNVSALFAGNGDGTFRSPVRRVTGSMGLTPADLDHKAGTDLVAFSSDPGVVYTAVQTGGGLKAALVDPKGVLGLAVDLNGDGRLDTVWPGNGLINGGLRSAVTARLGKGTGRFGPPRTTIIRDETAGSGAVSLAAADLNGDGKLDVAGGFTNFQPGPHNLFVALGDGTGHFGSVVQLSSGDSRANITSLALRDVTGDSRPDLVSQTRGQVSVLPGLGGTAFGAPLLSGGAGSGQIETLVGDVTGDGRLDVVSVLSTGSPDFGSGEVAVNRGAGNGTFTLAQTVTYDSNTRGGVLADLTGDGRLDVAVVGSAGFDGGRNGLYVMRNVNGSLSSPAYYPRGVSGITVGDFNLDGALDLTSDATVGGTELNLNDGTGHFGQVVVIPAAGGVAFSADLTGDEKPDIAAGDAVDVNQTP